MYPNQDDGSLSQSRTKTSLWTTNMLVNGKSLSCSGTHLVDPGDDCVLGVVGHLLEKCLAVQGFRRRVPVDAGHHPLRAHHLHGVRHHQGVDERQMRTLCRHNNQLEKTNLSFLFFLWRGINLQTLDLIAFYPSLNQWGVLAGHQKRLQYFI